MTENATGDSEWSLTHAASESIFCPIQCNTIGEKINIPSLGLLDDPPDEVCATVSQWVSHQAVNSGRPPVYERYALSFPPHDDINVTACRGYSATTRRVSG